MSVERSVSRLSEVLFRFWDWVGYGPDEFSKDIFSCADAKEPFYFPEFSEMRKLCCDCENELWSDREAEDYLTCMALDNEEERILDHCAENASDKFVERIALASLNHIQWHARWQVAELLGRRNIPHWELFLEKLSRDPHPYVRQRAENVLKNPAPKLV